MAQHKDYEVVGKIIPIQSTRLRVAPSTFTSVIMSYAAGSQAEIDLVREYTETVSSEYVKAGDKWGRVLKVNGAAVPQPAWMAIVYLGNTISKAEYSLPSVPGPLPLPSAKVKIVSLTVIANYEDGTTTTEVFDPVQ